MTSKQHPIGSGFTPASTADEVLQGIDLSGRNVIVTAGHVGLGLEATRALTKAGANVTVGARNPARAAPALACLDHVEVRQLDLLDPRSIDAFVTGYLDSGRPLHILINNAGIGSRDLVRDARGYESTFATNHLGHFQLTLGLLPALRAAHGARVVTVSSGGHRLSDIRWDDPHFTTGYDGTLAYAQAKTANILFAVELDRRWSEEGVRGYAVHPGIAVATSLARPGTGTFTEAQMRAMALIDDAGRPIIDPAHEKKTPQQAASTIVWAATSPRLANIGGVYLKDNDISPLDAAPAAIVIGTEPVVATAVVPHAVDPDSAQRLWDLSERLIKA
jgi:NAD(P)-dependent dehydrogenase (short-subunit alcohol dehydrogenase family)